MSAGDEELPPEVAEACLTIVRGLHALLEATRGRPEYRSTYQAALRTLGRAAEEGLPLGTDGPH